MKRKNPKNSPLEIEVEDSCRQEREKKSAISGSVRVSAVVHGGMLKVQLLWTNVFSLIFEARFVYFLTTSVSFLSYMTLHLPYF
jgi:hypothetical protein